MIEHSKIAIVDIETTGPRFSEGDRMIQIGAIIIQDGQIIAKHSMLLNPRRTIPKHIQHLTGIHNEIVANAPTFKQVSELWYERLSDCIFIAHNLAFDLNFLTNEFEAVGLTFNYQHAFDSEIIARILLPTATGYNLTDLAKLLSLPLEQAHNAYDDALVTAYILSRLASQYHALDELTKNKLRQLSWYLKNEEALFFKNYQAFILANVPEKKRVPNTVKEPATSILTNWFAQSVKDLPQVVVSTTQLPYEPAMVGDFLQTQQPIIIISNQIDAYAPYVEQICQLKFRNEFVNDDALFKLCKAQILEKMNAIEITQLSSAIVWLSQTKTGDYQELNQEMSPKSLFEKYLPKNFARKKDVYYERYLKQLNKASVIGVTYQQLLKLEQWQKQAMNQVIPYTLFVDDLQALIEQKYYQTQTTLEFSQLFMTLQQYYEYWLDYRVMNQDSTLSATITKALQLAHSISNDIQAVLSQKFPEISKTQEPKILVCDLSLIEAMKTKFGKLNRLLKAIDFQMKLERYTLTKSLKEILKILNRFVTFDSVEGYYIIRAIHFNESFFSIAIDYHNLNLSLHLTEWVAPFTKVVFIDQNFLNAQHNIYRKDPLFDTIPKLSVPDTYMKKTHILLPFGYMRTNDITQQHESDETISTYQKLAMQSQMAFLVDTVSERRSHIIIIVPNRRALEPLYQQLQQSAQLKQYALLVEGVTSSLNKATRAFNEKEQAILVMTRFSLNESVLQAIQVESEVFLHTLPFTSPNYYKGQQKKQLELWNESELFNRYTLDKMINDFSRQLSLLRAYSLDRQLYLFDERLYTKYYSQKIQRSFKSWVNFEIID